MPLYEYECKKCGHRFEKILKFSDKPMKKCPDCGGVVEQLISAPTVQFKGAGWYVTDYAKKGTSSSKPSDRDSGSSESGSKDTSKESKDSKDSKDSKESRETKKDEKSKPETSSKKNKKD